MMHYCYYEIMLSLLTFIYMNLKYICHLCKRLKVENFVPPAPFLLRQFKLLFCVFYCLCWRISHSNGQHFLLWVLATCYDWSRHCNVVLWHRFTEIEDDVIKCHVSKGMDRQPFSTLSKLFKRERLSIYKRYKWLEREHPGGQGNVLTSQLLFILRMRMLLK
jgi:hypothetical protein